MECIKFDYSTKNIPIPTEKEYMMKLIEMTEHFIKRVRWKALHYLHPEAKGKVKDTYGFKSRKSPPVIPELNNFEKRIQQLLRNIKFRPVRCHFQNQLRHDIKHNIRSSNDLLIPADKTSNHYKLSHNKYTQLLNNNVTKDYKKAKDKVISDIKKESQAIVKKLEIDDRVMKTTEVPAFITLKDHKDNFANNPSCRLINPMKPEIGKISKQILERINKDIAYKTNANLWRSTQEVLKWFENIKNKQRKTFIIFDIVNYYPSISPALLQRALDFATELTSLTNDEKHIIMQAKRSTLSHNNELWCKKQSEEFDITMGSYDGAESCELVGLYMLNIIKKHLGDNFGLYRDDGLGVLDKTPRQAEIVKKKLCAIFREQKLQITVEANKKIINYLDVTLDMANNTYQPYTKPNNIIHYVHRKSNHPPSIIKNIPPSINKRLSSISSSEKAFNTSKAQYQEALQKSGYNFNLHYDPVTTSTTQKRKRTRNVIWYNPPYSKNVATNIGKKFLQIISEEFKCDNPLHKILNKNSVKISYCCMNNVKGVISKHNKKIMRSNIEDNNSSKCNCRRAEDCPMNGKCLANSIVYKATVTSQNKDTSETYIGLTNNQFKARYNNHKVSFNNRDKRANTELSNYIWKLKDDGLEHKLSWKIMTKAKGFNPVTNKCNLCTAEKYFIILKRDESTLNERRDLITTCRHSNKHLLCS